MISHIGYVKIGPEFDPVPPLALEQAYVMLNFVQLTGSRVRR